MSAVFVQLAIVLVVSYLVGSIPFAYIIVRLVTGRDVEHHGTGNVGAMNVRRSTGSWFWFTIDMLADALKGFVPVLVTKVWVAAPAAPVTVLLTPSASLQYGAGMAHNQFVPAWYFPAAAVAGAVIGHNYSVWMALIKRRFHRTGKGLAAGAGALLAYDWKYFIVVVIVGLAVIAVTRYLMAGQVAAAASLPIAAIVAGSTDWVFCLLMAAFVIAAHWKRFIGMLQGREPKLYVNDRSGPRG